MMNWSGGSDVSCDVYIDNVTSAVQMREAELRAAAAASRRHLNFTVATEPAFFLFLSNVAEPGVCLFGIAGNILNLIILTRKQLQRSVGQPSHSSRFHFVKLRILDILKNCYHSSKSKLN